MSMTIDYAEITHFLDLLGKNGSSRLRAIPHKSTPKDKRGLVKKFFYEKDLIKQYQRDGYGIYLVINQGKDTADSIESCVAFFVEFDGIDEDKQLEIVNASSLPEPSIIVRTGGGSLHFYWVLSEPYEDKIQWQKDTKRLISYLGSDKNVNDPSRVMRLPGCWYMDGDKKPVAQVKIIHESEKRYSRDEFINCLPDITPETKPTSAIPASTTFPSSTKGDAERAIEMLNFINPNNCEGYDDWLHVGMALHHTDPGLLDAWIQWSREMSNFDEDECRSKWQSFGKSNSSTKTIATLHHLAKQGGYVEPKQSNNNDQKRLPAIPTNQDITELSVDDLLGPVEDGKLRNPRKDRLGILMQIIYKPRFNELTGDLEIESGEYISNAWLDSLYLSLAENYSIDINDKRAKDAFIHAAHKNSYHPVRDYLDGLSRNSTILNDDDWSLIAFTVFGCDDPHANKYLQRQLIAAVARIYEPGCKVDTALITHGKQDLGKSTFWRDMGGPWFNDSLGSLANMKDDLLLLHGAWIHEWGEIDRVIGKREAESVKHFITIQEDRVRPPYGRKTELWKRQSILVGTTNRDDFIKDHTGNRRFPIFTANRVNNKWVLAHRDAIWARAVAEYKKGTRWWYDSEEIKIINQTAASYSAEDELHESLEPYLEGTKESTIPTICESIKGWDKYLDSKGDRKRIGFALNKLGFKRNSDVKRTIHLNGRSPMRVCVYCREDD